MSKKNHITVCACTYKRPELLRRLLSKLEEQKTDDFFDYSIVIVDNDRFESARQAVEFYAHRAKISISYYVEYEQNISLARNKAIENAKGDFIGLIDDDEFPSSERWLVTLYKALKCYNADGILGPVIPYFEKKPPKWVLKGRFFDRETHCSGDLLGWKDTRTGNALLRRELFRDDAVWFDPQFGSGGEDRDFFRRRISEGHVFAWCNEAPVFEIVPAERWKKTVLIKRALLRGKMAAKSTKSRPKSLLISTAAIAIYTFSLPILFILSPFFGYQGFMKYLIKDCDHLGKILAFFKIDLVKKKYVGG
jgi:succinoglycan biosynthesis protein ExoM